jgi:hypothetical protein
MKKTTLLILFLLFQVVTHAQFTLRKGQNLQLNIAPNEAEVVNTALDIFTSDYQRVFKANIHKKSRGAKLYIGTIGTGSQAEQYISKEDIETLSGQREGFLMQVKGSKLIILGSDKRGTAYGIMELSRQMGVSPWEWWADAEVAELDKLVLRKGFRRAHAPSVKHRGIFLNDEGWGLNPWSSMTYEPSDVKGLIGPKTHARIFELLLRLRANTMWPAMHDYTVAFYLAPGNKEMADKYGIYIGTSHCEPMLRNTNAEWKSAGTGVFDFVNNRENVLKFWEERVRELAGSDNIYTLGIRGVHDSKMLGANTLQEQKEALDLVLASQREMIARMVNPDVEKVSQVFIPYKEVLDVYRMGLKVPEDVTLMWTDDNYGYIRHFPDSTERARKGGSGVYNHLSYWGRPHDYLWLPTNHPALVYTQQKLAYDKGSREIWIANVGDIKPAEYLLELFLDMAWDIDAIENNEAGLEKHLRKFLTREFGAEIAPELVEVMNEYYRLAWIRKPEFMGNTRTEESNPAWRVVSDLPWSESYIRSRIAEYKDLEDKVIRLSELIPAAKKDTWFQMVEYPVRGAAHMNFKHLYGQLARHGKADWGLSDASYDRIESLTNHYNSMAGGKWNRMMDFRPRRLAVYDRVPKVVADKPMTEDVPLLFLFNAADYHRLQGEKPVMHGLGYQRKAVSLAPQSSLIYEFDIQNADTLSITVALVPNHPVDGHNIRYSIALNDEKPQVQSYRTQGRSEEWKVNVLTNQATRKTLHVPAKSGRQFLKITALDEGVMVDQIKIGTFTTKQK